MRKRNYGGLCIVCVRAAALAVQTVTVTACSSRRTSRSAEHLSNAIYGASRKRNAWLRAGFQNKMEQYANARNECARIILSENKEK